jgi:hypothetical protein
MLSFMLFIIWIGVAPSGFFDLMNGTVSHLVADIGSVLLAGH